MTDAEFEAWNERAAIMEFDGGLTRFKAESQAAEAMGRKRWEFVNHANSRGHSGRGGDNGSTAGRDAENHLPGVLGQAEEEERPMPVRDVQAGRSGGVLPPLRMENGRAI